MQRRNTALCSDGWKQPSSPAALAALVTQILDAKAAGPAADTAAAEAAGHARVAACYGVARPAAVSA
ncbi:hypothetical protein MON38_07415 [Hymenobacter sp. DH14]|uniref:Uncharacterized protein n=1 Tax=Hymenobacter cyanobacteriorum TaxID=2926463 RepID=A0A9X1VDM7_9BACT|nr:hypothetical protein [Hymenobacter cyanobacteriorum]MCI1187244.1 hypothetical protein [Hymenobacter cyanobacteriorum]